MYTAVMQYTFRPEAIVRATEIWHRTVFETAKLQPGCVRLEFLVQPSGRALALGTWRSKEYADRFMKTGVFKDLLREFESLMVEKPVHQEYEVRYFHGA